MSIIRSLPPFLIYLQNLKTRGIPSDPLSPPESYPVPEMVLHSADNNMLTGNGGQSIEEKREFLVVTRNTLDLFSSILNSADGPKPMKVILLLCLHLLIQLDMFLVVFFHQRHKLLLHEMRV